MRGSWQTLNPNVSEWFRVPRVHFFMMYFTYVLRSMRDGKMYVGFTSDLRRRFSEHQQGRNVSTKNRRPFELLFYEAFKDERDALRRESYFKTNKGKIALRQIIRHSFNEPR